MVKVARKIPFLVSISYNLNGEIIEQNFEFKTTNKKYLKYAYDQRFCLKRKIDKLIDKELLSKLSFLGREDGEDKIIIKYNNDFGEFEYSTKIVNCEFYLPPYNGCKYCLKSEVQGNFLYCKEKKKHYELSGIKSCPIFQSINEVIS